MIHCLKPYSAYKKSGLPWLREVPEHWEVLRGKSLFSCIDVRSSAGNEELLTVSSERGVVPRSSTTVTMFKAESYAGYKLCWPGDLVINSLWAWARGLGVSRYHGIVSSAYGVYRLRPGFEAYSRFIHELVRSGPFNWELQVRSKGIWISRLQLTDEAFLGAPFPLPSPSEQLAIVRFLQYVDRRIRRYVRAKQKMIALLEEQTQALIHRAVSHGLDPNVRLKPSGGEWLGEVPEHWEVKRLKYLSGSIQMGPFGASLTELQSHDTGYKLFGQENTISGDFTKGQRWVTKTQYEGLQRYELLPGDLVLTRKGSIGKCKMVPSGAAKGIADSDTIRVRLDHLRVLDRFVVVLLQDAAYVRRQIESVQRGAILVGLNTNTIGNLYLAVPPLSEQKLILSKSDAATVVASRAVGNTLREISLLREYRTRLVADIVTGKLDVRQAAAMLPDEVDEPEPVQDADALVEGSEDDVELEAAPVVADA